MPVASQFLLAQNLLPALEDYLERSSLPVSRVAREHDRILRPDARFSIQELIWYLDEAAIEAAMLVQARHIPELVVSKAPSSGVWSLTNTLRLLGERVSVAGVDAKRLSTSQYLDLISRGVTFSDTTPVFVAEGGDFRVYGTSENPVTASAAFISLPEELLVTQTGTFTPATKSIALDGNTFVSNRDILLPIKLDNGAATGWGYIQTVPTAATATIEHEGDLSAITSSVTFSWTVPAFYNLPSSLTGIVLELAAARCFASKLEIGMTNTALQNANRLLQELPFPLVNLNG